MTTKPTRRSSLVVESLLFANRLLTRWRREPVMPIQALLYPTSLLVAEYLIFGRSLTRINGADGLDGLVPAFAIIGGMFGALAASFTIRAERDSGLLSRFWVLPVRRASALTGRILAEAVRTLMGSALITAVGLALGLRFEGSWFTIIPFMLVPVVVVAVFSTALIAIAVRSTSNISVVLLGMAAITAVLASSGAPPVEMLPAWLQPVVHLQPMWPTIELMRALTQGREVVWPLSLTLAWAAGLSAVAGPLAIRGYRTAAESSH